MSAASGRKWCFVPKCENTSTRMAGKIFLPVPRQIPARRQWAKMARREDANAITSTAPWFCCEDHFDLENDTTNWQRFNMVGGRLLLKKGILPHKFECQGRHQERVRAAAAKRDQQRTLTAALEDCTDKETDTETGESARAQEQDILAADAASQSSTSEDVGTQVEVENCDASTQSIERPLFSVHTQTDHSMYGSRDSDDGMEHGNHDSDDSYQPDDDSDEDTFDDVGSINIANLERMRGLCRKDPKSYMGLNEEGFLMLEFVATKVKGVCGGQSRLTVFDACCLVMVKLKQDRPFQLIADDFGISRSYACRLWRGVLPQISGHMQAFVFWPKRRDIYRNIPLAFKARFSRVTCIIDCLEIEIEKPSVALKQSKTYSSYKSCNTVKYLVSIVPSGMFNFVSGGYGGRTSDIQILQDSGFMDCLEPGMVVMADRGFKSIEPLLRAKACYLIRPDSVGSADIPEAHRVLFSKQVASLRVHVERAIRRIREFAMVKPHAVVECVVVPCLNRVLKTVCGFVNLQHDLTKV
ncbi:uncharacterized protein LOC122370393 isoform X1 [Amphibalanus amphitrite]|uniref:uncharacterized protein LOC122370393 isoform X1 n=1 Tax=Amphibalanus amphitrite TaxID=1232801 RepID=UPI001C914F2A|nr:uncharacterized protein LOC122370393 isoform X1 [Amphibalanus amphitrite]